MKTRPQLAFVFAAPVLLVLFWFANIIRFAQCDFESPYSCEVSHSLGIIMAPAAAVTVWFATDENTNED